jgi:Tol biopolymer transport system component
MNMQTGEVSNWKIESQHAAVSNTGEWVAFFTEEQDTTIVWRSNGADVQKIADLSLESGSIIGRPVWSDGGQQLAFLVSFTEESFDEQLGILNVDTGKWRFVTGPVTTFAWQPNSQKIAAFPAGVDSGIGLYVIDPDQEVWHRLDQGDHLNNIAWSPDGEKIVFSRPNSEHTGYQLVIMDVATGSQKAIYANDAHINAINWSPDGKNIVVHIGDGKILLVDPKNAETRPVSDQAYHRGITWSPDGERIAYLKEVSDTHEIALVVYNVASKSEKVILQRVSPSIEQLVWR